MSIATSARVMPAAVLALVSLAAATGAHAQSAAQSDEGFYVGLGFGRATFDQSKQEFDAGLFGSFTSVGFTILTPVSQLDASGTELHGLVGYRFNSYFGFELAFVDVGKLNYSASMTLAGGGLPSPSPASISGDLSAKGPLLSVIGTVPLGKRWELYGRLGMFYASTTLDVGASILGVASSSSVSAHSTDWAAGIGGALHLGPRFSLRLEYEKLRDVGDPDQTGEGNVDVVDLGLVFRL